MNRLRLSYSGYQVDDIEELAQLLGMDERRAVYRAVRHMLKEVQHEQMAKRAPRHNALQRVGTIVNP